jgi:hypothetical protein
MSIIERSEMDSALLMTNAHVGAALAMAQRTRALGIGFKLEQAQRLINEAHALNQKERTPGERQTEILLTLS